MANPFGLNNASFPFGGALQNTTSGNSGSNNAGAFGASNNNDCGGFGTHPNASGFGTAKTMGFGNNNIDTNSGALSNMQGGFRSCGTFSNNVGQSCGSADVPYQPHPERQVNGTIEMYHSISAMQPYHRHSHEELRLADYNAGRQGSKADPPQQSNGLFGSARPGLFGHAALSNNNNVNTSGEPSGSPGNTFTFAPANTETRNTAGGLFGNSGHSNSTTTNTSGSLFGNRINNAKPGCSLIANSTDINRPSGGLFSQPQSTAGGPFGNPTNNNTTSGGLFSNLNNNAGTSGDLFGASNHNTTNSGGGLFGHTNHTANTTGGLFGFANPHADRVLFASNNNIAHTKPFGTANGKCACISGGSTAHDSATLSRGVHDTFCQQHTHTGGTCGTTCSQQQGTCRLLEGTRQGKICSLGQFCHDPDHIQSRNNWGRFGEHFNNNKTHITSTQDGVLEHSRVPSYSAILPAQTLPGLGEKDKEIARLQARVTKLEAQKSQPTTLGNCRPTTFTSPLVVTSSEHSVDAVATDDETTDIACTSIGFKQTAPKASENDESELKDMFKQQNELVMSMVERLKKLETGTRENAAETQLPESKQLQLDALISSSSSNAKVSEPIVPTNDDGYKTDQEDEDDGTLLIDSGISTPLNILTPSTAASEDKPQLLADDTSKSKSISIDRGHIVSYLRGRQSAGSSTSVPLKQIADALGTTTDMLWAVIMEHHETGFAGSMLTITGINMQEMVQLG